MVFKDARSDDFLDQLGALALGSRLKRLSERMLADAGRVYQHFGIDVQPRWFPLMALLQRRGEVTVVEAADAVGVSQPAISQFAKQLAQAGLVDLRACRDDGRRRRLTLTAAGEQAIAAMQPMWAAVDAAARELCAAAGFDVLAVLRALEHALAEKSLLQRTLEAHDGQAG